MNKPLSTFERKMKNNKFKKAFEESYKKLLFSELMMSVMEGDDVYVKDLAKEADLPIEFVRELLISKHQDRSLAEPFKFEEEVHKKFYRDLKMQNKKRE